MDYCGSCYNESYACAKGFKTLIRATNAAVREANVALDLAACPDIHPDSAPRHHGTFVIEALSSIITVPSVAPTIKADVENFRRGYTEPSSEGFDYLIRMEGKTFYKMGMRLDP